MVVQQVKALLGATTREEAAELQEFAGLALDELYARAVIPALRQIGATEFAQAAEEHGMRGITEYDGPLPASDAVERERGHLLPHFGEKESHRLATLTVAERLASFRELDENRRAYDEGVLRAQSLPLSQASIPRYYVVRHDDSLENIALAVFGDESLWPQVIAQYQLYPPYFSETPTDGLLAPGTRLLLPATDEDREENGLGYTFALEATSNERGLGQEWDLIAEDGSGLAIDAGLQALGTDLALRLATPLGSLRYEPEYGVASIAGVPRTRGGVLQEIAAMDSLLADSRVLTVETRPRRSQIPVTGVFVGGVIAVPRPELLKG